MFESQPRRHPLQTFQFWFVILFGAGGLAAWQAGLIGRQPGVEAPAVTQAETPTAPPMPEEVEEFASPLARQLQSPPQRDVAPPQSFAGRDDVYRDKHVQPASAERIVPEAAPAARPAKSATTLDWREVQRLLDAGDEVAAHRLLSTCYWHEPGRRPEIEGHLNALARKIYFQPQPHYLTPHRVEFGDRLETIAKAHAVSWEYLGKLNRVQPERLPVGGDLKVLQGPFCAVVDLSRFELTVHAHGYYVARFDIGVGQDESAPLGNFRVIDKLIDPTYYGPDGVIDHDDPRNPLGEHWLAINNQEGSLLGFGLHGCADESLVGGSGGAGYVRLRNEDAAELFDLLTIGSEVVIRP